MLSKLNAISLFGLEGNLVQIETVVHRGTPKFQVVGLGDAAVQESRERVKAAIRNSGYKFPGQNIVTNLAPADLKKSGPRFDMAIALSVISAYGQVKIPLDFSDKIFLGECALEGFFRPISGILPSVSSAVDMGIVDIFVPTENAPEAALIKSAKIYPVKDLKSLINHFLGVEVIKPFPHQDFPDEIETTISDKDFAHIKGNEQAKRVMEIAAAGGHNLLMSGPPGSGKTMLAQALSTILPDLSIAESLEITKIHSIAGLTESNSALVQTRPFRSVHHTASGISIVGGGNPPKPGEISLAHRGVLFLDELPEFPQKTLEVLRQPLEDGKITISRAAGSCVFPTKMMFIAAMNPTPCGYPEGDPQCTSSPFEIKRYRNKISGPLLDRIDLHIDVPKIAFEKLSSLEPGETSASVRKRVVDARSLQKERFAKLDIFTNSEMSSAMVKEFCTLDTAATELLRRATIQMDLSGRVYFRILKLARTIADLENVPEITSAHIAEAISYRQKQV